MSNVFDDKDAMWFFMESLATGDPSRAIENQEKRGQQSFVRQQTLPKDLKNCTREQLESLGFVFGDAVDDLFVEVTFPEGWKKVAENHAMWSRIEDEQGRERASIFYKAAFYDRSAHFHLSRRFSGGSFRIGEYDDSKDTHLVQARVTDCGKIIWSTEPVEISNRDYKTDSELDQQATDWLNEHYPDWKNPLAYWDK